MSLFRYPDSDNRPMVLDGRRISSSEFRIWARALIDATDAYLAKQALFVSPPEPGNDSDETG